MLQATGLAGAPASLFYEPDVGSWAKRMGMPEMDPSSHDDLHTLLKAARHKGCGDTSVFGLRQQWPAFPLLCETLAKLYSDLKTDQSRLTEAFGPIRFVHLSRTDKRAQAISLLRAQQSGLWHVHTDGSDIERIPHPEQTAVRSGYDTERIFHVMELLTAYDQGWTDWFAKEGLTPLRIRYEALAADPRETLKLVLGELGLPTEVADNISPDTQKMADAQSALWARRHENEI